MTGEEITKLYNENSYSSWEYKLLRRNPIIILAIASNGNSARPNQCVLFHVCRPDVIFTDNESHGASRKYQQVAGEIGSDNKCESCGMESPIKAGVAEMIKSMKVLKL